MLVQLAICKCHPKFTHRDTKSADIDGEEEQVYEEIDGVEGGVVTNGERVEGSGNAVAAESNEAYSITGGGNALEVENNAAYGITGVGGDVRRNEVYLWFTI